MHTRRETSCHDQHADQFDPAADSMGSAETQRLIQTATKHGLQTRDAELRLGAMLAALSNEGRDRTLIER